MSPGKPKIPVSIVREDRSLRLFVLQDEEKDEMSAVKVTAKPRSARKPVETDLGFTWGVLNTTLLVMGLAVLVAGYFALSRGSITLAPALLVLGYCGFIPASLLVRGRNRGSGE